MEDENENNEQQNKIENLEEEYGDLKADVYFLNSTIKEVELPISLNEFREKIKGLFLIKNRKNDEIFVIYSKEENDSETTIEVKTDEDYIKLLKTIKESEIKDNTILIEIDKVPSETNRTIPETYEEEIQCVVERELKVQLKELKNIYLEKKTVILVLRVIKKYVQNVVEVFLEIFIKVLLILRKSIIVKDALLVKKNHVL